MYLLVSLVSLLAMIGSAHLAVDVGMEVPVSMQSLAVCLVGYFDRRAVWVCCLYVMLGIVGLPVFADGASGWSTFVGPSMGYLLGFVLAVLYLRYAAKYGSAIEVLQSMMQATLLILMSGFLWLSITKTASIAWHYGVVPFLPGASIKVLLATLVIIIVQRVTGELAA